MLTFTDQQRISVELNDKIDFDYAITFKLWKAIFDVFMASIMTLFVLSWLIPLVGLLIKLTSVGPVLYVQWRTGRNGQPFRCYKFRTMVQNDDSRDSRFKQTIFNDTRITRIGYYLRRTNLDEMPQFINVLLGDMSVVGPRPHAVQHDSEFWFSLPNYEKRYNVQPGITGLAQIRGVRGIADDESKMRQRLKYDLFYIKNCSLSHDFRICWWTIKKMLRGDNNAW